MIPQSMGCGRRLYRTVQPILQAVVDKHKCKANRYRKRFKADAHAWILILHMMKGAKPAGSLRQSHAELGANPTLRRKLGLGWWISFSQLARSSTSRAPECFEELVMQILKLAQSQTKPIDDPEWKLLNKAKAIDSTFLGLSAKLSPWSLHGKHAPGMRVQFGLDLASHIPEVLCLTGTEVLDNKALGLMCEADLTRFQGWTLVMDLGYYAHKQFEQLREWDIHFLSKLHPQAAYQVTHKREVTQKQGWTPQDDEVVTDEVITLGSLNNRRGAVL